MAKISEKGYYDVKAIGAEFGESDKGTPFLKIEFQDLETLDTIISYSYLSEKAFEYTDGMLRDVFEFDGDYGSATDQILGKEANIYVELEEYDGKERAKVKYINAPGSSGGSSKPIENQSDFLSKLTQRAEKLTGKKAPVKENPF